MAVSSALERTIWGVFVCPAATSACSTTAAVGFHCLFGLIGMRRAGGGRRGQLDAVAGRDGGGGRRAHGGKG